jgi:glyoxylase-like metal-dependent hydrolase (beta-lactamase superfamily II)
MITDMARRELVKHGDAFREHLRRLASIPDLVRVIPGHGKLIREKPAEALRAIAESL